ncbi:hypothetical protein FNP24_002561 [Enterococcus faecalis]|nr:hypothetical protein [Enterococcus faecalis]
MRKYRFDKVEFFGIFDYPFLVYNCLKTVVLILKLDLSFTITAIIALCALITPLLTTHLNNSHQRKMKELEYHQQDQTKEFLYVREKMDNYLKAVGQFIGSDTAINQAAFEEAHFSLLPILPFEMIPIFEQLYETLIVEHNLQKTRDDLHKIIVPFLKSIKMGPAPKTENN